MNAKEIQAQIDEDGGELIAVADLVPWLENPRDNEEAAEALAAFIAERGWAAPVIVQRGTNRIIGGHTRWKAATRLGIERIPVRIRTCDDRTATALALADNKLAEIAQWNFPAVAEALSGYSIEEAERMGWTQKEIEALADHVPDFGPPERFDDVSDQALEHSCPRCGFKW